MTVEPQPTIAQLQAENARLRLDLAAARERESQSADQQSALARILGIIASSPADLQPVLDAVAESASQLCDATDAVVTLAEGEMLRQRAHAGQIPADWAPFPLAGSVIGEAMSQRRMVHIHDITATGDELSVSRGRAQRAGWRTALAAPLFRGGMPLGGIMLRRREVRPFTDAQIQLLEVFAHQAMIAIENTRLFQELEARNTDLAQALARESESLEKQTATSEVLRVIASSPTDVQAVLDTVAENAARLCGAGDAMIRRVVGDELRLAAHYGPVNVAFQTQPIDRGAVGGRAVIERRTVHVPDLLAEPEDEYPINTSTGLTHLRTVVATPMLSKGIAIGVILVRHSEVRPFTQEQIALLETFADQAVIAIENTRLFRELEERNGELTEALARESEALEQQTAMSEVLRVIASSPTDLPAVLYTVAENAARLCGADDAVLRRVNGDSLPIACHYGPLDIGREDLQINRGVPGGRAVIERRTVHIPDMLAEPEGEWPGNIAFRVAAQAQGLPQIRTLLVTPLLSQGVAIGSIHLRRMDVNPFTAQQIALLETFADQAVIAIENARLFQELEDRNRDLSEALEQQRATGEILRVIASSPTDLHVLKALAESAARLCGAYDVVIRRVDDGVLRVVADYGPIPVPLEAAPLVRGRISGRAVIDRRTIHVPDVTRLDEVEWPEARANQRETGHRSSVGAPLMRAGAAIGSIVMRAIEPYAFSDKQVALLETFADQAVIAIENTRLFQELEDRNKDLAESLVQQTTTSDVLRVIASSPTDLQTVLDSITESAARVCDATDAQLFRVVGDIVRLAGKFGPIPSVEPERPLARGSLVSLAILDRVTFHVPDAVELSEVEYPDTVRNTRNSGTRTMLVVPLMRDDVALGSILIRRTEVRPFTEKQVALLETFADQAVIAIENTRLFQELQDRNKELDLALEQQTATGEVLRVIASSPTDLQTVLDTVAENAARLCGAVNATVRRADGDILRRVASYGWQAPEDELPIRTERIAGRAFLERRTIHVHDYANQHEYKVPNLSQWGLRTALATPLMREGAPIGTIMISLHEMQPFTDAQVALLETFADQAVIAIENARLFQELEERNGELTEALARESEALQQQTAMSEVLRVIASSPTDLQAVLYTVAENAARLCAAEDAVIRRVFGAELRVAAHYGVLEIVRDHTPVDRGAPGGRAVIERRTVHVPDLQAEPEGEFPQNASIPAARARANLPSIRTLLVTPLLSQGAAIGTIHLRRLEVNPFTDQQIALLETFADQAVIAIENARLFQELEDRNKELDLALEQQTATGEVLRVIASSPTDLQTVLDTVAENAARLCGAVNAAIRRADGGVLRRVASYGWQPPTEEVPIAPDRLVGRPFLERRTLHIVDLAEEKGFAPSGLAAGEVRTLLITPLLREGTPIGTIQVFRNEVQPFSDAQIALLETFADQAVIAIENARLFEELEARNSDLGESLEQQTATSEVLRVIASSPADLDAVLNAVAENAMRLCEATDAVIIRRNSDAVETLAHVGTIEWMMEQARPLHNRFAYGRAMLERRTVHYEDVLTGPPPIDRHEREIRRLQEQLGVHTVLATPLLRQGEAIGAIYIRRTDVRRFTDKQILLLETFADQAVIAIENARLFGELQDRTRELAQSVEELQALGLVSQAVSSTLDLQDVLTTVLTHAVQLSGMDGGAIFEFDEATGEFHDRATLGLGEGVVRGPLRETPLHIGEGMLGRAVEARQPMQVADIQQEGAYFSRLRETLIQAGYRAMLAVPLLREDQVIGGLVVRRGSPGEVPSKTVELLQTFATQSALAIQNARLFNELAEKSQQLEIASQHKSQFLANMSHELRTPLNAILGYTELILDEIYGEVPEKIGATLERVQHSGRHLLALINDVLDLSKMEAGQLDLAPQEFALADVIQTVQTAVESLAAEKGIGLRSEVEPDLPMGYADDRRLVQVILNLVGNAIKFTDRGEVVIGCQLSAVSDQSSAIGDQPQAEAESQHLIADSRFLVSVRDTGPGITPEQQGRIFEEFQQADTSTTREKGGTGLGLSIARRIVELHGGRIWVESEVGQGSTFAFEIPVRTETPA